MPNTKQQKKIKRNPVRFKRLPKGPNGGIQLLLIQNVEHLGKQGDVVEVKPGYANNYLIPQGLATIVSDHHRRMIEKHRTLLEQIQNERKAALQILAAQLREMSVSIEANSNVDGHLYGSVGATEIVAALRSQSVSLDEDQVRLEGPLRELGMYTVKVHLGSDVESEIRVWVVPVAK